MVYQSMTYLGRTQIFIQLVAEVNNSQQSQSKGQSGVSGFGENISPHGEADPQDSGLTSSFPGDAEFIFLVDQETLFCLTPCGVGWGFNRLKAQATVGRLTRTCTPRVDKPQILFC